LCGKVGSRSISIIIKEGLFSMEVIKFASKFTGNRKDWLIVIDSHVLYLIVLEQYTFAIGCGSISECTNETVILLNFSSETNWLTLLNLPFIDIIGNFMSCWIDSVLSNSG